MKLEALQENLTKALGVVSRIISTKPQIPILSHVLLLAKDNNFTLTASNTETTIIVPVGSKIEVEGSFTLPARTFQDLVASLPPGKISLESSESQVKIKSVNFSGKINGTPAAEFPVMTADFDNKTFWKIDSKILTQAVGKTLFSTATDESRALLTGVLFKVQKNSLILAATDGFRLSRYEITEISIPAGQFENAILPAKSLSELSKLLTEKEGTQNSNIKIHFLENNQVLFIVGETKIYSRLISGTFPDFEKIIPTESAIQIVVNSEELNKTIKTASIFARESANIVKLNLVGNKLKISANASEVGENESEIDVEVKKGNSEGLQIAFNYRYILDFLNSLGKDTKITVDFNTSLTPGVFRTPSDKNFLHLIMPVRVQS